MIILHQQLGGEGMKTKLPNKVYSRLTTVAMDFIIIGQIALFLMFDISHKPEALVNYVITFIVLCMTRILTSHYLSTIPEGSKPISYYYSVIVSLYLYAFSYTLFYTIPHNYEYKTLMDIALIFIYCLGFSISLSYGLYFVQFYNLTDNDKRTVKNWLWGTYIVSIIVTMISPIIELYYYIDADGYVIYKPTSMIGNLYPLLWFIVSFIFVLRSKQSKSTKAALLSYSLFALVFLVIDITPKTKSDISIDSSIAIGILFSIYTVFLKVYVQDKVDLAEKQAELVEQQSQIMISQIQPHFLYNTLSAIYALCGDDPRLAQKTIKDFSVYLRHNMNSLNSKERVPFEKELEHTKTYLAIEQLRFDDLLKVEYDVECTDFSLPALTLQPIVENAVKYGIRSRENGGTVSIKVCRRNDKINIVVHDDGMGFDVNKKPDDDRSHVGIDNTRHRVEVMCNGSLTIDSVIGVGTTVTIILEDKNEYTTA